MRGGLIYVLAVVGLQANYAAATSQLRFEADTTSALVPVPFAEPELTNGSTPIVLAGISSRADVSAEIELADPAPPAGTAPALPSELLPLRDKLLTLMTAEQPYLEPELSLAELAQRLRTNTGFLSKVINTGCGQNFNEFVNSYRVAEAQRKLQDPRFAHYSLVGVALESGFNSKSTFNRVFKKLSGQAPGEVGRLKS